MSDTPMWQLGPRAVSKASNSLSFCSMQAIKNKLPAANGSVRDFYMANLGFPATAFVVYLFLASRKLYKQLWFQTAHRNICFIAITNGDIHRLCWFRGQLISISTWICRESGGSLTEHPNRGCWELTTEIHHLSMIGLFLVVPFIGYNMLQLYNYILYNCVIREKSGS